MDKEEPGLPLVILTIIFVSAFFYSFVNMLRFALGVIFDSNPFDRVILFVSIITWVSSFISLKSIYKELWLIYIAGPITLFTFTFLLGVEVEDVAAIIIFTLVAISFTAYIYVNESIKNKFRRIKEEW